MIKSNKGFTLVELIVVIAILAILAGVAVPAYSGYMTKAKDAAVLSELDAVKTACFAVNAATGSVADIELTSTGLKINGEAVTSLAPYYADASLTALQGKLTGTTYANGAVWTAADGWKAK